jgi:hypothetical protein
MLENPTAEDLFRVVMIDKIRKVKLTIKLKDKDGDEIPIVELVEKLTEYVGDKLADEGESETRQQIFPLMAQAVVAGLMKLLGHSHAAFTLSQETTRYSLIHMMAVAFYLLKWVQQNGVKIYTTEEPVSEEDIDTMVRISKAGDMATQFAALGGDPHRVIKEFLASGELKPEDLQKMGVDWSEEEQNKEQEKEKKGNN